VDWREERLRPAGLALVPIDLSQTARHAQHVSSDTPPNRDRDDREHDKKRIERLIPVLVKRLVETGVEKLADSPETVRQWANELRLPKELLNVLLAHVEDAKSGVYKVVVREVREFLAKTTLADELTRVLTGVTLEVKTQVRFVPNDANPGRLRPSADATVSFDHDEPDTSADRNRPSVIPDPEERYP
jgi:hypothetical protein